MSELNWIVGRPAGVRELFGLEKKPTHWNWCWNQNCSRQCKHKECLGFKVPYVDWITIHLYRVEKTCPSGLGIRHLSSNSGSALTSHVTSPSPHLLSLSFSFLYGASNYNFEEQINFCQEQMTSLIWIQHKVGAQYIGILFSEETGLILSSIQITVPLPVISNPWYFDMFWGNDLLIFGHINTVLFYKLPVLIIVPALPSYFWAFT